MIFEDFMIYALLAGLGVALAAGPLGCFVVWRQMAYFGDATAHAAILGVAMALLVDGPISLGVLVAAIAMAVLVVRSQTDGLAIDTMLGVAAHAALAVGLVAVSLVPGRAPDLESYLFGDILSLSEADLAKIAVGVLAILGILYLRWNALLIATLNEDLASAEGLKPEREHLILALLLATLVAVAIKVVGALLITAMLIIPAASARSVAQTPERMALFSIMFGVIAVLGGLQASASFDTPAGPSIVTAATVIFFGTRSLALIRR